MQFARWAPMHHFHGCGPPKFVYCIYLKSWYMVILKFVYYSMKSVYWYIGYPEFCIFQKQDAFKKNFRHCCSKSLQQVQFTILNVFINAYSAYHSAGTPETPWGHSLYMWYRGCATINSVILTKNARERVWWLFFFFFFFFFFF